MSDRPKRERKQTSFIVAEAEGPKRVKHAPPSGQGTKLGDMPYCTGMMNKYTDSDDIIKYLHLFLIGGVGSKGTRKKLLRQFCGFQPGTDPLFMMSKLIDNKKWTVSLLKEACDILGLDRGGNRDDICRRIVDFCMSPTELKSEGDIVARARKASSGTASGKKRKRKKDASGQAKKKRGPTSFILFSSAHRAAVRAEFPEYSLGEVGKHLGRLWGELSEAEKEVWKQKAAEAKAALDAEEEQRPEGEFYEEEDMEEQQDNEEQQPEEEFYGEEDEDMGEQQDDEEQQ